MSLDTLMRALFSLFFTEVIIENRDVHLLDEDGQRVAKVHFTSQPPFITNISGEMWAIEKIGTIKTAIKFCNSKHYYDYMSSTTIDHSEMDNVPIQE